MQPPPAPPPKKRKNEIPYYTVVMSCEGPIRPHSNYPKTLTVQTTVLQQGPRTLQIQTNRRVLWNIAGNIRTSTISIKTVLPTQPCSAPHELPTEPWPPAKIHGWQYDISTNQYTQRRNNVATQASL